MVGGRCSVEMARDAVAKISTELRGQVRFMAQYLFVLQTIPADVFFFHWILHN
ncbi:hypothetical protein F5B20DRAFT_567164 [Whalleya microplaca]|nr:hypothetical protein F5B20DRAFT_567164 [Whalleya microplaca]